MVFRSTYFPKMEFNPFMMLPLLPTTGCLMIKRSGLTNRLWAVKRIVATLGLGRAVNPGEQIRDERERKTASVTISLGLL